jgi:DNA-binding transcriptional ArsR family regulator
MPPSSSELISAVGHPLRRRILNAFLGGPLEGGLSAQDLAAVLDRPIRQIDYHLKALARSEILRPVGGSDRRNPEGVTRYGWALGVEEVWLRLVLEVVSSS